MRALFLSLAVLSAGLGGCRVHLGGYEHTGPSHPPPPPPEPQRQAQSQRRHRDVLEVKEIHASTVRARIIYAKEVHAGEGDVGRIYRVKDGREHWGEGEVKSRAVEADVIYAKEIHADYVEAAEIHAQEVKLGR